MGRSHFPRESWRALTGKSDEGSDHAFAGSEGLTVAFDALDDWLIRVVYGVLGKEARCAKCQKPLGRDVRLAWSSSNAPGRRVLVTTRCCGLWRHRHMAIVALAGGALEFGLLAAQRRPAIASAESVSVAGVGEGAGPLWQWSRRPVI